MFDLDVEGMLERLTKIPNTTLLCSNPCVELWFLLHYTDHQSVLTSDECLKRLQKEERNYIKGSLSVFMKRKLSENNGAATERAKTLLLHKNPSSSVYRLIEELQKIKNLSSSSRKQN